MFTVSDIARAFAVFYYKMAGDIVAMQHSETARRNPPALAAALSTMVTEAEEMVRPFLKMMERDITEVEFFAIVSEMTKQMADDEDREIKAKKKAKGYNIGPRPSMN